jgi:hypothetical protein
MLNLDSHIKQLNSAAQGLFNAVSNDSTFNQSAARVVELFERYRLPIHTTINAVINAREAKKKMSKGYLGFREVLKTLDAEASSKVVNLVFSVINHKVQMLHHELRNILKKMDKDHTLAFDQIIDIDAQIKQCLNNAPYQGVYTVDPVNGQISLVAMPMFY